MRFLAGPCLPAGCLGYCSPYFRFCFRVLKISVVSLAGPVLAVSRRAARFSPAWKIALGYSASLSETYVLAGEPCPLGLRYALLATAKPPAKTTTFLYFNL